MAPKDLGRSSLLL